MKALEERLRKRNTETEETLAKRLAAAKTADEYAQSGAYDKVIVNDDVEKAYGELLAFVKEHYAGRSLYPFKEIN